MVICKMYGNAFSNIQIISSFDNHFVYSAQYLDEYILIVSVHLHEQ